jgi:enoyl-CoA hydratase/carnithine racemase
MEKVQIPKSYDEVQWDGLKVSTWPPGRRTPTQVMTMTISRPEKANSFTVEIEDAMIQNLEWFDLDDRVKSVVVTGEGRFFCAGADLEIGLHRAEGESRKDHRDG